MTGNAPSGAVFHYLRKTAILRSIVDGTPGTAICGERIQVARSGAAVGGGSVICPICACIYECLPSGSGQASGSKASQ